MPYCGAPPADTMVVKVLQEDQGLQMWRFIQLSKQGLSFFPSFSQLFQSNNYVNVKSTATDGAFEYITYSRFQIEWPVTDFIIETGDEGEVGS